VPISLGIVRCACICFNTYVCVQGLYIVVVNLWFLAVKGTLLLPCILKYIHTSNHTHTYVTGQSHSLHGPRYIHTQNQHAQKTSGGWHLSQIEVTFTPSLSPVVAISLPLLPRRINPTKPLILRSSASPTSPSAPTLRYAWRVIEGDVTLSSNNGVASTPTNMSLLVINAGALTGGAKYVIRLSVFEESLEGWADVALTVNQPPLAGSFAVTPMNGMSACMYLCIHA
jgi:hypothetical protein